MSETVAPHRGRPRSPEADKAIASAALEVLVQDGAAGFSVEAVAHRAGVGKSTIYRRFTNANDLLAEALATLNDDLVEPDADLPTREALILIVESIRSRTVDSQADRCLPQVLSQAHLNPELFEIYYERVVAPRRERVRHVIERGIARGDIRADVDVEMLIPLFTAPMVSLVLMTPPSRICVDDATAATLIDAVMSGVAAR